MVAFAEPLVSYPLLSREFYPYQHLVPRELGANLSFRRKVIQAARGDRAFRADVKRMCAADPIFFINTFGWALDPRRTGSGESTINPFITWPAQDIWLDTILRNPKPEGKRILIKKPRDRGMTWLALFLVLHKWLFSSDPVSILLVSRKLDLADGDSDSLMYKVREIIKRLPSWLVPAYSDKFKQLRNDQTDSLINAEATTTDLAAGGRRTMMILDEFGKVEEAWSIASDTTDVTDCRIFISTPYAESLCFEDMWRSGIGLRIEPRWWDRPEYAEGLYRAPDGTLRSPRFDEEERTRDPNDFRVNVLGEFLAGGSAYFSAETLAKVERSVQDPWLEGVLHFDSLSLGSPRWESLVGGPCKLWLQLQGGRPPRYSRYVMGVDIATGTGASNSAIAVLNAYTGEKVMEWAETRKSPRDWAKIAVAAAKWFNDAQIIHEANGPGRDFEKGVVGVYDNIYWRTTIKKVVEDVTDFPGWWTDRETKEILFGGAREAIVRGRYLERSRATLDDLRLYVYGGNGEITHVRAAQNKDSSGARQNHGDRAVATALAVRLLDQIETVKDDEPVYEQGTVGHRWHRMAEDERSLTKFGERAWRV